MNSLLHINRKFLMGCLGVFLVFFCFASTSSAQSIYTVDDIESISSSIKDFSEQRWSTTVVFDDGESNNFTLRNVEDQSDLFEQSADRIGDRYDMSLSLAEVAEILEFDEKDFDEPDTDIRNLFAEPDKLINGRWEVVVDSDSSEDVIYVYSVKTEEDLVTGIAGKVDLIESTVRSLLSYDQDLFSDQVDVSKLSDIIAAPDARVDYKWVVRVEYSGDGGNDSEFVLYGIFSTDQLHREIADHLEIEIEEAEKEIKIKKSPFEKIIVEEDDEMDEEEEEEKEEKEPIKVYKLSEISRVELIERGADESGVEQYEVFVVTNDGSRIDGGGMVSRGQTDENFYRDVARRINSRAHFTGFNDSNTESKAIFTVDPLVAKEREVQKKAVERLLVVVLEILNERGDEQALEEIRKLLVNID